MVETAEEEPVNYPALKDGGFAITWPDGSGGDDMSMGYRHLNMLIFQCTNIQYATIPLYIFSSVRLVP